MNTLVIRADATTSIGTGHFMRCLALGQAWQDQGGKVAFISVCDNESLRLRLISEGFDFIAVEKTHPDPGDLDRTLRILGEISKQNQKGATWLVLDGYNFDGDYQKRIKQRGYKLLWIDDYGHADHYFADMVLNQNISVDESLYTHREPSTRLLLGTRYALLRREFRKWQGWQREIPVVAGKVLVTLGGGDPDNVTLKAIKALKQITISGLEVKIVIGPANPNIETLEQETVTKPNFHLLTNVTNMSELMAWADLAVSAGGSTSWEMAFMGLPNVVIVLADNQRPIAEKLHEFGAVLNLGWHSTIVRGFMAKSIANLILSVDKRRDMSKIGRTIVDGNGTNRLIKAIDTEPIFIRKAIETDCNLILKWANDPTVRDSAFHSDFISVEKHKTWFNLKLKSNNSFLFIGYLADNKPVGQIRFDKKNNGVFEVDVSVDKDFRSQGYGVQLIKKGIGELVKLSHVDIVKAFVKIDNYASQSAFKQAGFLNMGTDVVEGTETFHFTWKIT